MKLKMPYYKQAKNTTCGVACVRMVLVIVLLDPAVLYGGVEGFGHFVVITGFEDGIIYYHGPDLDQDLKAPVSAFFHACKQFSCKGVKIWKSTKR